MNVIEAVKRHFDVWNRHDADAIVALFAEGGTYSNPVAGQGPYRPSHRELRQRGVYGFPGRGF
jgi:hypothetical protein